MKIHFSHLLKDKWPWRWMRPRPSSGQECCKLKILLGAQSLWWPTGSVQLGKGDFLTASFGRSSPPPPPLFTFFGRFHHDPFSGCKLSPQQKFSYGFVFFLEWCVCSWFMPVKKEDTDGFGCGGVWTLETYANLISPENWIQSRAGIESDSVSVFIRVY